MVLRKLILTIARSIVALELRAGLTDDRQRAEFNRVARYLIVGGWNTVFGIGVYALLYWLLAPAWNYLVIAIPANILAITNAYLGYKLAVFRTRGNWWREYWRCYVVYGGGALLGMVLLWMLVSGLGFHPVPAQIATTALTIIGSYLGHKYFSFRKHNG